MVKEKSRLVVIDASVTHSAGETNHPASSSSRKALSGILEACHHVVVTEAWQKEWRGHRSRFARKWYGSMLARRKVQYRKGRDLHCPDLDALGLKQGEKAALGKDVHLVEAACAADGIIITLDSTTISLWSKWGKHFKPPRAVRWINPLDHRASWARL